MSLTSDSLVIYYWLDRWTGSISAFIEQQQIKTFSFGSFVPKHAEIFHVFDV